MKTIKNYTRNLVKMKSLINIDFSENYEITIKKIIIMLCFPINITINILIIVI